MQIQTQSSLAVNLLPLLNLSKATTTYRLIPPKRTPPHPISLRCSLSTVSGPPSPATHYLSKPLPAEISRTIMELSSVGTLSTLNPDGWPLGVGVPFAVDHDGTPVLCFNRPISSDKRSTLHVQLEQGGLRTPQCTIQGNIDKPGDKMVLKRLRSVWKKRFSKEINEDSVYVVAVDRVLQTEDIMEDGVWVTSLDYKTASPDPLRDVAENIINEINDNNMEDIFRFCNVYVELDFQVTEAKMIWMDRLGFDLRMWSLPGGVYDVRIPFPVEVTDEKGAKSSFNGMSQLAWEIEKSYHVVDYNKVEQLKPVATHK